MMEVNADRLGQNADKSALAHIMNISVLNLKERYRGCVPAIFGEPTIESAQPGRTDWVITVLALGELSYDNSLPALGSEATKHTLKSGEVLHFVGDIKQTYSGTGGGTCKWFHWSNLSSTP